MTTTWQVILLLACIALPATIYYIYKNSRIKNRSHHNTTPVTPRTVNVAHNTPGVTTHTVANNTNPNTSSVWKTIWNIIGIVAIIIAVIIVLMLTSATVRWCDRPQSPTYSAPPKGQGKEALVLVDEYDLDENNPSWTTPYIDYKFKIRTEGHAINIKFTGMRNPVPYPPEGNFNMPAGAQPGPAIITRGPGEKRVHVQLYKKITI